MKQRLCLSYSKIATSTSSEKKLAKVSVGCSAFDHSFLSSSLSRVQENPSQDLLKWFGNSKNFPTPESFLGLCQELVIGSLKSFFFFQEFPKIRNGTSHIAGCGCPHQLGGFRINLAVRIQINWSLKKNCTHSSSVVFPDLGSRKSCRNCSENTFPPDFSTSFGCHHEGLDERMPNSKPLRRVWRSPGAPWGNVRRNGHLKDILNT